MKFARVASMISVALLLASVAPSMAEDSTPISVQSGHSIVLEEHGLSRVAVGDAAIAGVAPVGSSQLIINGKKAGRTTVFVWTGGGRESYEVTVLGQGTEDAGTLLRSAIPFPNVQVTTFGKVVLIRGTVDNGEELASINDIIHEFSGAELGPDKEGGKITPVVLVTVKHPLGDLQDEIGKIPGVKHLRVDADKTGNVIVSGLVPDRVAAESILGHVRGLAAPYLGSDGKVIDRLEVAQNTEIDIKVQVLEVNKSAQNELGVSLQSAILDPNTGTYSFGPSQFPLIEGPAAAQAGKGLNVSGSFLRLSFLAPTITALINHGDAKILSEPHLLTTPGEKATFLVGGEIPYVVSTSLGQVSVEFKEYGVQLNVTPQILPNGAIQSLIAPDISNLDYQDAVTINGFSIPAISESKLSTTAISRPGESIVLGGMLQHIQQRAVSEFPILGQLPILGKLFRSTTYQNNQSDVVFVLTPQIVNH